MIRKDAVSLVCNIAATTVTGNDKEIEKSSSFYLSLLSFSLLFLIKVHLNANYN